MGKLGKTCGCDWWNFYLSRIMKTPRNESKIVQKTVTRQCQPALRLISTCAKRSPLTNLHVRTDPSSCRDDAKFSTGCPGNLER